MILSINSENPDPRKIKIAATSMRSGGVVIFPTDTIYAMGCSIFDQKAVERICRIKNVQIEKSNFSFICHDLSNISNFTRPFDRNIYKLVKKLLPGPYTFILNSNSNVPSLFKSKKKTIGIRIPANEITSALVSELGNPIMTTSLHDEDEFMEYPTDPEIIYESYKKLVDIVIDGGFGNIRPSTVIDCTQDYPVVVREGAGEIPQFLKQL
jgi:tRNA threonylcarbamoyl adenosine modification protein (Sua5/YciO/YrdC/YwlC family)